VGAGYLGLEVAAVAAGRGVDVTVLEGADRVLARVAGTQVSQFVTAVHEDAGVKIVTGVSVDEIVASANGLSTAVACTDGRRWEADTVLVAIGVLPQVALAESAGLACDNGILVNGHGRTSDPRIYAAGDCANHLNALYGRRMRLESVNNAVVQGKAVASAIAGCPRGHTQMPWFWSDQYHHKLQTVGVLDGHTATTVRGDPDRGSFAVLYLDGHGGVLAVDAVNAPREFSFARSLLGRRAVGGRLPQPDVWPRAARPIEMTVMR